jgi:hypothetical protein
VTTNRIHRTVRMSVLSLFIALMAFSFLAIGTASAHSIKPSTSSSQTASNSTTTVVRIMSRSTISPNAITVKSGARVRIVNKSPGNLLVFYNQGSKVLAPGAALTLFPTVSQSVTICAGATLTITVA